MARSWLDTIYYLLSRLSGRERTALMHRLSSRDKPVASASPVITAYVRGGGVGGGGAAGRSGLS